MNEMSGRECPACGERLTADSRFCSFCGAVVPPPVAGFCPNCGEQILEGQNACFHCGCRIGGEPEPVIYEEPVITEMPPEAPPAVRKKRTGLWVTLAALALVTVMAVVLVVLLQPKAAESVTLERQRLTLQIGQSVCVDYEVLPQNTTDKTVVWSSSDPDVAQVVGGEILAVDAGACVITVTTTNGLTSSCTVTVSELTVEDVTVSQTSLELYVGDEATLSCQLLPAGVESTVTWRSDNGSVASVRDGVVTAIAAGTCTVTVQAENGVSARCTVTVSARLEEELVVGTWELVQVEDRYNDSSAAAKGETVVLNADQTGTISRSGRTYAMTWRYSRTDSQGDYWYELQHGLEEDVQMYYSPVSQTLCLYWEDEIWVLERAK